MRWTSSFWSSRRTRHQSRETERDREERWTGETESPGQHWLQVCSEDCLNSIESFPAAVWLSVYGSLSVWPVPQFLTLARFWPLFSSSFFLSLHSFKSCIFPFPRLWTPFSRITHQDDPPSEQTSSLPLAFQRHIRHYRPYVTWNRRLILLTFPPPPPPAYTVVSKSLFLT
ncbi:hypothetical protein LZ32DRAFT_319519 [Colletotrichum eremochloae]|nr:hypothetical protein LZ32DRAFT_319519 [Colletotrichum eremochloae]